MPTLEGYSKIYQKTPTEMLNDNLLMFFDWGFVDNGAFFNVTIPTSGGYGGSEHILKPVKDPNYTDGKVWQAFRKNWVWESGTQVGNPIQISGVYVNNTFIPASSTGGYYGHYYDYPNGRVVFNNSMTGSGVRLEYSYKYVSVNDVNEVPWLSRVQYRSFNDFNSLNTFASGSFNSINRVQLPCLVLEINRTADNKPYELGETNRWTHQDVYFYAIADTERMSKRIAGIVEDQVYQAFTIANTQNVAVNSGFPLDYRGSKTINPKIYPRLTQQYPWQVLRFIDGGLTNFQSIGNELFISTVRLKTELIV